LFRRVIADGAVFQGNLRIHHIQPANATGSAVHYLHPIQRTTGILHSHTPARAGTVALRYHGIFYRYIISYYPDACSIIIVL
jgi:hypothetical protein